MSHIPVLCEEVIAVLAPRDGATYVDGTFGSGGYSEALLRAARCWVIAIDRDPDAIARGEAIQKKYGERLTLIPGRFGDMAALLGARHIQKVEGIVLDLGVSSFQIDEAERGFSFRHDGPLDMRMEKAGPSAADIVNTKSESELAKLLFGFGEERRARAIARAIVAARTTSPLRRTGELAELVRRVIGPSAEHHIDPATRTFQALRIAVNDELGEIDRALEQAGGLLAPGGRLAIVTFHSLEDRRVKHFFRAHGPARARPSRHLPPEIKTVPLFERVASRSIVPGASEIARNPRARSARLRWGQKALAA
ncbi:MAG TPA: 16S rRNA (cytosine(1402)-N(4))-methyltransferase RsmH [Dongiaceae bacterium]|jgi:16S rRNA (cytosine1402-N4)-methyltransferase|nr:16S rRNA (cytosine(1402)-N(4))-methyltransferase RsmH [Dongiaceae bacterium]